MRPSLKVLFLAPALVMVAACNKDKPADSALSNDLTLAAQARQTATLDSISAAERARTAAPAPVPAPTLRTSNAPVRRTSTSTRHRSGSSSGGSSGRSSGDVVASEPRTVTEKHTNRDAAIGAAAGAIIGGASSHSVKGGVIGAAAGGILGAVIGNNVDIKKKKVP